MADPGVFTLSLDTELAWGSFDRGGLSRHGNAYRQTPEVVDRLCTMFDRHGVSATWAVVGHLLEDCDGSHEDVSAARRDWLARAPCSGTTDRSLWYAPDLLERIRAAETDQEIGLHGYSHLPFDRVDRQTAREELEAAVGAAETVGVEPTSFVFPRNRIAHVDLLAEFDFDAYRGRDARWYEGPPVPEIGRKPLRFVDEALSRRPPVVVPTAESGVVRIPGSQIFRPAHGAWGYTPADSQRRRAEKGLERAAETGRVFHLWLHPFNLGRDPEALLATLDAILARAAELREAGKLTVASMAEVAAMTRDGRWGPVDGSAGEAHAAVAGGETA